MLLKIVELLLQACLFRVRVYYKICALVTVADILRSDIAIGTVALAIGKPVDIHARKEDSGRQEKNYP